MPYEYVKWEMKQNKKREGERGSGKKRSRQARLGGELDRERRKTGWRLNENGNGRDKPIYPRVFRATSLYNGGRGMRTLRTGKDKRSFLMIDAVRDVNNVEGGG